MPAPLTPVLSATGLSFSRGRRQIIAGVGLDIARNERLALVGPSGAGKTTLLRLLAGLEQPDGGEVRPRPSFRVHPNDGEVRVGLLFQDLGLFPHMTVRSNVEFALSARAVPRRERRQSAESALGDAGLAGYGNRYPSSLSGGERQRVALVRTLLSEPAVILLDEPFASLDPHLIDHFAKWLDVLQRRTAIPMLLVTHDVSFALRWAHRLLVMADGRIIQSGRPNELYHRPANEFVGRFLGPLNALDATVRGADPHGIRCVLDDVEPTPAVIATTSERYELNTSVRLLVRPHDLEIDPQDGRGLPGLLTAVEFTGAGHDLVVAMGTGISLRVSVGDARVDRAVGDRVVVSWPPSRCHVVPR